jgi:hypothetical protein
MGSLPVQRLAVVVPVYRGFLDANEATSLRSAFHWLGRHHLVMVKPEGLDTSAIEASFPFSAVETFDPGYFRSIQGYNRLLLSSEFYRRFLASEFMLVCQLDVFVFHDDLARWVEAGYDYVGAPWVSGSELSTRFHQLKMLAGRLLPGRRDRISSYETRNKVGNGGFSLRKVATHHRLSIEMKDAIDHYLANQGTHHFHEDVFWSLEPARRGFAHRTPGVVEALSFAWDVHPERLHRLSGGVLPMAAHGWYKRRQARFWERHVAAATAGRRMT